MNKEKEIEEMAKIIVNFKEKHSIPLGVDFHSVDLSRDIIEAGYRKADEVRKETEKRIYQRLYDLCTKDNPFGAYDLLKEDVLGWAKEDGVEVDG